MFIVLFRINASVQYLLSHVCALTCDVLCVCILQALLRLRDGRAPPHGEAVAFAADVAYGMTIRNVDGRVVRDVEELTLSDFLPHAANERGPLGKLVLDAARVALPDLIEALRRICGLPPSVPSPAPNGYATPRPASPANAHGSGPRGVGGVNCAPPTPATPTTDSSTTPARSSRNPRASPANDPLVALQDRAAAALQELASIEASCGDLLDSTHRRHAGVRQLLAASQAASAAFKRTMEPPTPSTPSSAESQVPRPPFASPSSPPGYANAHAAAAAAAATTHESVPPFPRKNPMAESMPPPEPPKRSSPPPTFAVGDFVQYRRANGVGGARTVKVVEVRDDGVYGFEYDVETTAEHLSRPPGSQGGPIQKHDQVLYKLDNAARVVGVDVANQSYSIAVRGFTDASRLSRE